MTHIGNNVYSPYSSFHAPTERDWDEIFADKRDVAKPMKWKKQVPLKDGWFWCRSKGKNGWRTSPAEVVTMGPYEATPNAFRY